MARQGDPHARLEQGHAGSANEARGGQAHALRRQAHVLRRGRDAARFEGRNRPRNGRARTRLTPQQEYPMSDKITPVLWFDGNGEEAANFYVSLLPDSRIDRVTRSPADYPSGKAGDGITVD